MKEETGGGLSRFGIGRIYVPIRGEDVVVEQGDRVTGASILYRLNLLSSYVTLKDSRITFSSS